MTALAGLTRLNELNKPALLRILLEVCQSPTWRNKIADNRPYTDVEALLTESDRSLEEVTEIEIEESLINHPRIGAKNAGPRSTREQSQFVNSLSEDIFEEFSRLNKEYEDKFGFLYLVAAHGKSADAIIANLKSRLPHTPSEERTVMHQQLAEINKIRLRRLLEEEILETTVAPQSA